MGEPTGWAPATSEHTFRSGRTATIRTSPNLYAIFGVEELAGYLTTYVDGTLKDPVVGLRISQEIVRAMLLRPRLLDETLEPGVPSGSEVSANGAGPVEVVAWIDVDPDDVAELLEIFQEGADKAARFREQRAGDDDGADGPDVAKPAKPAPRARPRKR